VRISKLEIIENPKIKNIVLDFKVDDNIQDTIILAGNNGCGKTAILEDIFYAISQTSNIRNNEKIICTIQLNDDEIELIKMNINNNEKVKKRNNELLSILEKFREYEYILDFDGEEGTYDRYKFFVYENGNKIMLDSYTLLHYGNLEEIMSAFFSTANINYNFNLLNTITTIDLDSNRRNIITSPEIGTDIKQTFIDIYNLDAQDFQKWASENVGKIIEEEKMFTRIKRFSNAFSYMFDNIKFDRIINKDGHKDVIFKNNKGEEIKIDDLSTGEKQIIIRGGYVLKYQKSIQTNFILIDEPELSLHPEWQKKILQFYKKLFTNDAGKQTAQIFVATHSPFIIHNSARYNDKVIVLNKDSFDNITVLDEPFFYSCDNNQIVEKAFNINMWNNKKSILFTEGETDEKYIKAAIKIFFNNKVNFKVEWIGKYNQNGNPINTGSTGLNNLIKVLEANPQLLNNKVGFLFDCDTNKENKNEDNYFIYSFKNIQNNIIKKGIENQLIFPKDFCLDTFIDKSTKIDDYGVESVIATLNKNRLCDYICTIENNKEILINLKNAISEFVELFNK